MNASWIPCCMVAHKYGASCFNTTLQVHATPSVVVLECWSYAPMNEHKGVSMKMTVSNTSNSGIGKQEKCVMQEKCVIAAMWRHYLMWLQCEKIYESENFDSILRCKPSGWTLTTKHFGDWWKGWLGQWFHLTRLNHCKEWGTSIHSCQWCDQDSILTFLFSEWVMCLVSWQGKHQDPETCTEIATIYWRENLQQYPIHGLKS